MIEECRAGLTDIVVVKNISRLGRDTVEVLDVINICTGRPEKLADRAERFIKENGYKIKLKYGAFPDRPYDSKAVWGDTRKIKKIIG